MHIKKHAGIDDEIFITTYNYQVKGFFIVIIYLVFYCFI